MLRAGGKRGREPLLGTTATRDAQAHRPVRLHVGLDISGGPVVVWAMLTLSTTLGIVGLVGLLHECWTSARASVVFHSDEAHTQPVRHAPQSTYHLLLHTKVYDTDSCGQQSNLALECTSAP